MINVHVYRDSDRNIVKYIVEGHAQYSKLHKFIEYLMRLIMIKEHSGYPEIGSDVVCAAVSSVAQSVLVGLTEVVGLIPGTNVEDGYLECILPAEIDKESRLKANVLLDTMVLTLKNLEEKYIKLIKIVEMEV